MGLTEAISECVSDRPGAFAVSARHLGTGETIAINADRPMNAESAAKTFILVYFSQLVASGAVDPMTRVRLDQDNRHIGTGVLRYLADGIEPTLSDLAWLMIMVSDNTATAMLMQAIGGPADVNAAIRDLGYPTARFNETITVESALAGEPFSTSSTRDLAEIYTQLDDGARAMLFRQQHLVGLPRLLPHMAHAVDVGVTMPIRVYNKTGNGMGTFIDSGLFETDAASWIVAAMAAEQTDFACMPDDSAPMAFGAIGELLFNAWGGV